MGFKTGMMTEKTLVVTIEEAGERLDKTLAELLPDVSRSRIQQLIKDGCATVDEQTVAKPSFRPDPGQVVKIVIPALEPQPLVPESIPLDIIYQDDEVVVVNKPPGMVVHPAAGHQSGTLVNALLARFEQLARVGGQRRPGIVHRLDKDTSGLVVVALTEGARLRLKRQFQQRQVRKVYLALAKGVVTPPHGIIDAPIGRDPRNRKKMAIVPDGREATTEYHTLEVLDSYTLIEALPKTGRTHQIRVHLAFLGFPLAGDTLYGHKSGTLPLDRQFLHAYQLTFALPSTGEERTFTAPVPEDLQQVLDWLNSRWSAG
jgi:23S rRNA pseudouridine1911/1915/1917 synthase